MDKYKNVIGFCLFVTRKMTKGRPDALDFDVGFEKSPF